MKLLKILLVLTFPLFSYAQTAEEYFKPVKFRSIGPFRGGRSVASSGVVGDPLTYYMSTTGGGLWKTEDAGQRWKNISDGYFKTGSVGAVAVSESDPNIVYCGMGEHAPRGVMSSYGDGVYKSMDAGRTWVHIGLKETQHIARIVVHPKNPDLVYVAAQGQLYGPNKERGIFKTTDGGKTWVNVLYVNDLTGCSELSMDMNSPQKLYATMWEHQRLPWKIVSGGKGSGVYKSSDGGESWDKIEEGLPKEKGKSAISVSRANSDLVYLLLESDSKRDLGGLFVSKNAGENWKRISDDNRLTQRAWYYTEVFADPNNENTVYVLSAPALRSTDGGKTWSKLSGTHGDYHDLWINRDNSKNMVVSNDGGAAITFNSGRTWSTQANMPTAQFYRVNADNLFPYNIYGGQQDNSSVKIASLALGSRGIDKRHWSPSAGGESAFIAFDPDHPRYAMGGSYLGSIELFDAESGMGTNIMNAPIEYLGMAARDMRYLFNWNAPIIRSRHEPVFYHCAQYVLKTTDKGKNWSQVSPDLTRDIDAKQGKGGGPYTNEAVGAENYGTISYIAESPHQKGVFWTGSDDGYVYLTQDNCSTWTNVTPKGLDECLINAIEVSPHQAATAYIATTRYKFNDHHPGLYKTDNYGKSWTKIDDGIPIGAYTRVVREDKEMEGLLFAGTETGLFISWNGGQSWQSLQLNLPVTPINDLLIHKGDLILATSGRSFWILDDIKLLGQYDKPRTYKLYEPKDAIYGNWGSELSKNTSKLKGFSALAGVNPANGIVIYYELPEIPDSVNVEIEIRDLDGELINNFSSQKEKFKKWDGGPSKKPSLTKEKGLNRFVWNTRYPIMPGVPNVYIEGSYHGHKAYPGRYKIIMKVQNKTFETYAKIRPNPLIKRPYAEYVSYDTFMSKAEKTLTDMHQTVNKLHNAMRQIGRVNKNLVDASLKKEANQLIGKIKSWDGQMVQRMSKAYDDVENFENKLSANYLFLINRTESDNPQINQSSVDRKAELDEAWLPLKKEADEMINILIPSFNKSLWDKGIGAVQTN